MATGVGVQGLPRELNEEVGKKIGASESLGVKELSPKGTSCSTFHKVIVLGICFFAALIISGVSIHATSKAPSLRPVGSSLGAVGIGGVLLCLILLIGKNQMHAKTFPDHSRLV